MEVAKLNLKVEGMTCGHCVRAVTGAVRGVAPQAEVEIDLEKGLVKVSGIDGQTASNAIVRAIEEEGYKVH
ncbi:heavy-metal-associated domain-containing protein [Acidiphilium multivorum]|uniref:heavy-metal-associated domain-containing protein n=1 Tax=Acidiphilium multivorum TaxID=62140 RepID=UPI0039C91C48